VFWRGTHWDGLRTLAAEVLGGLADTRDLPGPLSP
jgi:hypothetical protein